MNASPEPGAVSLLERLAAALADFQPSLIEPEGRRQATVALMLRERDLGLEFLVIRRAENEHDPWSGHMALPGGGRESKDRDVYDTARRETLEEVGMDLDEGRYLGRLDDAGPRTMPGRLVVSTVVVALDAEPDRLDPREVVEALWVPADRLVDEEVEIPDFPGSWPAFTYKDRYVIWGLTHRILTQLWALIPA
ncbi:CoA pyrophosphatase [soil metagenome]|jgi:8-oxo-dGTP pyrophosphatase MutT (NUDIX family)